MNTVMTSTFDKSSCEVGVVHVGYGAFHRAHQAVYIDAYLEKTGDLRWGIAAVNLRPNDSNAFKAAQGVDGYLLKTVNKSGEFEIKRIRSHISFSDWATDKLEAEALVAKPSVKLITITVTESGYSLNEDYTLNKDDPLMVEEFAGRKSASIYAYLRTALHMRRISESGAITVMSCDNLRSNGKLFDANFKAYLAACEDLVLLEWVTQNVTFPCCMVDRITPQPTLDAITAIQQDSGTSETNSIMAEDFIQWVVEDNFADARPDLDKVGATFVGDVIPYEETKIRVLNGGHTALVYLGALAGHKTFDKIMADPILLKHFDEFELNEVIPALGNDGPIDLNSYLNTIRSRFENKNIADTVERIAMDGVSKFGIFIAPTIARCFELGITPTLSIRSVASWYVFARNVKDKKLDVVYTEPNAEILAPFLIEGQEENFSKSDSLWGELPQKYPSFNTILIHEIKALNDAFNKSKI